jgi:chromatin remodeling complex protein RSC6
MSTATSKKHNFSNELQAIGAKKKGTRGEALKAIWAYAAENDLKESKKVKGRNQGGINPDDALADVFGSTKWHGLPDVMKTVSPNLLD